MPFELPALPYAQDALEPHYSAETLEFHHGKHHNAYVVKANELTEGSDYQSMGLEDAVAKAKAEGNGGLFNQVAQIWNHTFFWNCMKPGGGGEPAGALADAINAKWGSTADFVAAFKASAVGNFGSGWTWLVQKDDGSLDIVNTSGADTPLVHDGMTPILTVDVWEHAYYIDYRNRRPDFVQAFFDHLVNWDFVAGNMK